MSKITAEYIEQLKKEATAQLPERVKKNLEYQSGRPLTNQQVVQINDQINKIPMSSFMGYLMYGIIHRDNIDQFTHMSPERRDIALAYFHPGASPQQPQQPIQPAAPEMPQPPVQPATPVTPQQPVQPAAPVTPQPPVQPAAPVTPQPPVQPTAPTTLCLIGVPPVVSLFSAFFQTVQAKDDALAAFHLLELPGELFTSKVANGQGNQPSTADLDPAAMSQLQAAGQKIILFVIDPTVEPVTYHHLTSQTDADGNVRNYSVHTTVSQAELLRSLVLLLQQPDGRPLLQNVHSLFVATVNTSLLGAPGQRDQEALHRLRQMSQQELNMLIAHCQELGINRPTNGLPVLFTFGIGNPQESVSHQYAPDDVNKLVQLLKGNISIADN